MDPTNPRMIGASPIKYPAVKNDVAFPTCKCEKESIYSSLEGISVSCLHT